MIESEKQHLVAIHEELILSAVPQAKKVAKYGGTLFTRKPDECEGQFCGVFAYKSHVQLSFASGTKLKDPDGRLEGKGKFRRHLKFGSVDEVDAKIVKRFVLAASKL